MTKITQVVLNLEPQLGPEPRSLSKTVKQDAHMTSCGVVLEQPTLPEHIEQEEATGNKLLLR